MSLKYWYTNTAVFFSTLASWPASVTEPSLGPSLGILCFTELLDTYLYFSLTSLRVCWFIGWLNAWKVLLVDRRLLLWNHPICYGPRSKILIIVSFDYFCFSAVPCPPWQVHLLHVYKMLSEVQHWHWITWHITRHVGVASGSCMHSGLVAHLVYQLQLIPSDDLTAMLSVWSCTRADDCGRKFLLSALLCWN